MARRSGPAPRPALSVVREGNPGKRKPRQTPQLPPGAPKEPDWRNWFPVVKGDRVTENRLARKACREEWRRIVPILDKQGLLAQVDHTVLVDHCITAARILVAERDISRKGIWVMGERGAMKNPSVTAVNQYRANLRSTIQELGLSPASRSRLSPRGGGQGGAKESPWDV